jgi:hypothetical protein
MATLTFRILRVNRQANNIICCTGLTGKKRSLCTQRGRRVAKIDLDARGAATSWERVDPRATRGAFTKSFTGEFHDYASTKGHVSRLDR